jgi:NhaP-type Na+/H+ or K+/H+ antiporter
MGALASLTFGSLISATDPVTVIAAFTTRQSLHPSCKQLCHI